MRDQCPVADLENVLVELELCSGRASQIELMESEADATGGFFDRTRPGRRQIRYWRLKSHRIIATADTKGGAVKNWQLLAARQVTMHDALTRADALMKNPLIDARSPSLVKALRLVASESRFEGSRQAAAIMLKDQKL